MTQSEICSFLYQPKQTVNSSLKKLASEGYIQLSVSGHRSKQILLTEKGRELTSQTAVSYTHLDVYKRQREEYRF